MKKTNLLLTCLMAMFTLFAFTSCDTEDHDRAMVLSGEWTGYFGMYYFDGYREYDAYRTDISFTPAPGHRPYGTGIQVDHYRYPAPYSYLYYRFNWEIRNGVIYLSYPYDPELDVAIYEYDMTNNSLTGYVGTTWFSLRKIYDYYDWTPYVNDYGYCGWGYANTRAGEDTDSTSTQEMPQIKVGNRFKEKKQ